MRKTTLFNDNWTFTMPNRQPEAVKLPHTWNGKDGQDGGNNYVRTQCTYIKMFTKPDVEAGGAVLIEFHGVNSECEVFLNGNKICAHEGGYSTFHADITNALKDGENELRVAVTNEKNDRVYPQRADFTFYGGIYRDVYMVVLPKNRFEFGPFSSPPLKLTTEVSVDKGILLAEVFAAGTGEAEITVLAGGKTIAKGKAGERIEIPSVHLWDGLVDPFLYTVKAELKVDGVTVDEVTGKTGFRTFYIDPDKGFFLNGRSYPLRGVCRHQDRPAVGNAISKADHGEDMDLILEIGANTVRLAHYQHDQYFYDLCDEKGLVVWAEIPYISEYLPAADENACSQIRELVLQNYNHPSIICWGVSNEIMIKRQNPAPIAENHRRCHEICKAEDPSRLTVVACYAMTGRSHPTAHVTDIVSWNYYFGWYFPGAWILGLMLDRFHKKYKKTPLGLSEYGAEAMTNLHSASPKRLDNTEDYQCIYHENTMKVVNKRDYIWATHIWNMFDFGSDGRNQGGEPGMNHKGLVSFDRKTRKDAFYFYKAIWSTEKFVHISGKRYANRTGKNLKIKVYSNCGSVVLKNNGQEIPAGKKQKMKGVFEFTMPAHSTNNITVSSGVHTDTAVFKRVSKPDPAYRLSKTNKGNNMSWEK